MRTKMDRMLNNVSRPDCYEEAIIESVTGPLVLSIWKSRHGDPTVLFIPGTKTHPLFYEDFLNQLAMKNVNVIGLHLVGHGKSPRVKGLYTYNEMLQNGLDAIQYALDRFGSKLFLVGSSLGGILCADLAGRDSRIKGIFPHNLLVPSLPESIVVTRFGRLIPRNKYIYKAIVKFVLLSAFLFPRMQIPFSFYLEDKHIYKNKEIFELFYEDPIGLIDYPLYFLASLFRADLSNISNGSINCPVIMLVVKGDPIVPFEYNKKVFQMIKSPKKEMLLFEGSQHFILNESYERVAEEVVLKISEIT
ncbi:MAG: alpha/beta fold hydrolase, partial [Peptococcaceae bacterium]|nr:alpha/beta fold hydrolase [Peptococcaceae bacterium]